MKKSKHTVYSAAVGHLLHEISTVFEQTGHSVSNPIIMGVRFRPKLMSEVNFGSGSFSPGQNRRGVAQAPSFFDAADRLSSGEELRRVLVARGCS